MPSLAAGSARYGTGQYFTDIEPSRIVSFDKRGLSKGQRSGGGMSLKALAAVVFGNGDRTDEVAAYIAVDVRGLPLFNPREHVFLVPNLSALPLSGRIVGYGLTLAE